MHLTPEEKERFLKMLDQRKDAERASLMYHLMLGTGLRLSETTGLNVADVEGKEYLEVIGKGQKHRRIYLTLDLRKRVAHFLRWKKAKKEAMTPDAPLFLSRNDRRISNRQVQRDLTKWLTEAGISANYSPHDLRHTVGSELVAKTGNPRVAQRILGHSDVGITMRYYVGVTDTQMKEALESVSA
jgi:integrase/recombinase XerC